MYCYDVSDKEMRWCFLYYANDERETRIYIDNSTSCGKYTCPACGEPVIAKKGNVVSHHFAHKRGSRCDLWYKDRMSKWHREMQSKFPQEMQEVVVWNKTQTEYRIADVMVQNRMRKTVLEFQYSSFSAEEFIARSSFYLKLGYHVVWVFNFLNGWSKNSGQRNLYYDKDSSSQPLRHFLWPGKDRIHFFESDVVRDYLFETKCNEKDNLRALFLVSAGLGKEICYGYEFEKVWYKWQYVDPFNKELYYIKPHFMLSETISDFYATSYSVNDIHDKICAFKDLRESL